jgi:hypothetical protein
MLCRLFEPVSFYLDLIPFGKPAGIMREHAPILLCMDSLNPFPQGISRRAACPGSPCRNSASLKRWQ